MNSADLRPGHRELAHAEGRGLGGVIHTRSSATIVDAAEDLLHRARDGDPRHRLVGWPSRSTGRRRRSRRSGRRLHADPPAGEPHTQKPWSTLARISSCLLVPARGRDCSTGSRGGLRSRRARVAVRRDAEPLGRGEIVSCPARAPREERESGGVRPRRPKGWSEPSRHARLSWHVTSVLPSGWSPRSASQERLRSRFARVRADGEPEEERPAEIRAHDDRVAAVGTGRPARSRSARSAARRRAPRREEVRVARRLTK